MNTIRDLLASSLRKIGVLGAGEVMSAQVGNDALMALQVLVDDMANESLLIPVTTTLSRTVDAGQTSYTIGTHNSPAPDPLPDNHIDSVKPIEYKSIYIRDSANNDYSVSIIPENQYARIGQKLTSGRPSMAWIKDGWPLDTLIFNAAPYDSGDIIKLNVLLPLSEYMTTATLNDTINMPPGYKRMILYNLCIDLAPEWEKSPSKAIVAIAHESKRNIKGNNLTVGKLISDAPRSAYSTRGHYSIEGGP